MKMDQSSSIVVCDYCNQILEAPILLPCEHTICKHHFTPDTICIFCDENHGQFYTILKKLENLIGKLRSAKNSYETTISKLKQYEAVKFNPLECINQYFNKLQEEIISHKELTIKHLASLVEAKNKEILDNLDVIRNQCIDSLDYKSKISLVDEMADLKSKLEQWSKEMDTKNIKISETGWEAISVDSLKFNQIIDEKILKIKEDVLLNKEIKFEFDLKKLELINYGKLNVNQTNLNSKICLVDSSTNLLKPNERINSLNKHPIDFERSVLDKPVQYIKILGHLNYVFCVCFDRTGRFIFTGSDDKLIKIWRVSDGMLLATLKGHQKEISDLDVSYENTILASASYDKKIRIWNILTTENTEVLLEHIQVISCVKFSPYCKGANRYMVSAGSDFLICFWQFDSKTGFFERVPVRFKEEQKVICISFSKGGAFLAAGIKDNTVSVFYINNNKPIRVGKIKAHSNEVNSIQYAYLSNRFVSGSKDGIVRIWDYDSKKKWHSICIDTSYSFKNYNSLVSNLKFTVNMCVWNCDDSLVITAQNFQRENSIKVWNSKDGSLIHEFLDAHTNNTYVLEAHQKNPYLLLSASHDGFVILWNLKEGEVIEKFYDEIGNEGKHGGLYDLKWCPNKEIFASTDSHGYLTLYGYLNTTQYENTPIEQFFHTDYRPLSRDKYNRTIDKKTGIEPHLLPPSILINSINVPHKFEFQKRVNGLENLTEVEYNKRLAQNGDGTIDVIDECDRENNPGNTKFWVKKIVDKLDTKELERDESIRLTKLSYDEKYFNEEFGDMEIFKDTDHENVNKKRRERNNRSVESNDEIDNLTKTKNLIKNKTELSYKRIIRPNDSDDFEQNTNETSIDSEFFGQEEQNSDEDDEIDFEEDADLEKSDIRPSTSKKKRKVNQKL